MSPLRHDLDLSWIDQDPALGLTAKNWVTIHGHPVNLGEGSGSGGGGTGLEGAAASKYLQKKFGKDKDSDEKTAFKGPSYGSKADAALETYTADSADINGPLRHQGQGEYVPHSYILDPGESQQARDGLQTLFASSKITKLDQAITVYRGVRGGPETSLAPGMIVRDHGYASTTTHQGTADTFAEGIYSDAAWGQGRTVKIHVPAGTPLAIIGGDQHEILLNAGTAYHVEADGSLRVVV